MGMTRRGACQVSVSLCDVVSRVRRTSMPGYAVDCSDSRLCREDSFVQ